MVSVTERVRFSETDMMGNAHHANHIRWFECARCEYMRAAGVDLFELMDEGILFPIKNVSCEYIDNIYYDDEIIIEFTGEMKPFILKNLDDDSVIQLVLPVRTYN